MLDIPGKIIESTEALTEQKMKLALELTKILYDKREVKLLEEEKIIQSFFIFYDEIKKLYPAPIEDLHISIFKKHKLLFIAFGIILMISLISALLGWFLIK